MTNNTNLVLNWLKTFQTIWLPENIPNDILLLESIKTKLIELEQIISENNEDEEEYHRAKLLNDQSSSNSETEQRAIASTSTHETSVEHLLNIHLQSDNENQEEQSRQLLLEQSDSTEDQEDETILLRPSIRLKRISQLDAERYMPPAWNNATEEISSDNNKKTKRKLSTVGSDISSISPKSNNNNNNEISTTSSTSSDDDDDDGFNIKYRTRKSVSHKTERSPIKLRKHTNTSHKKTTDVIINYKQSTVLDKPSSDDSLGITEDITPMDEDRILKDVIENNDNESIFASLDIAQDKPMETNSHDDREDLSNDGINQLSNQESSDDRPPVDVPSYAHLLGHSKSLSDSDSENLNNNLKKNLSLNNSKRLITSSPQSDASPVKKKSKVVTRQQVEIAPLSSSSDDNENDLNSTLRQDASVTPKKPSPPTSNRIQIERSSSSSSEASINDTKKRSRQRRKKPVLSSERSNILKQIKLKTKEKKSPMSSTTSSDSRSDNDSKTKKSKVSGDDDDDENQTTTDEEGISASQGKHGRKNIRKILHDKELDVQTKEAIEAERERRKRIAEKQKEYNDSLLDQSSYMPTNNDENEQITSSSNPRLILELDKTTNEPLIEVSPKLVEQLKPHQCDGIRFLWNNVFESIDVIKNKKHHGNGCILAHCMGLGKTLQVVSFIHTIFNYKKITNVKTCLVLCPINAALNWSNEFDFWLNKIEPPIDHYQLTLIKPNLRVSHLNYWYKNGGVVIMGYEMYRRLASGFGIKNKKLKAEAFQCLVDPGPDIVVADEGHILKNAQTALAKCLSKIKTPRRIVLTGTPLQNNLIEYYCMVSFIKPSLLGSQSEYINRFVNPIQNGQHRDSNEDDVRLMKRRACVLHELLTGFVDRKDYSLLKEYLPPKYEYIINIRLSDLQSRLYEIYLEQLVDKEQRLSVLKKDFKSAKLFADYQYLQKIWTNPFLLYPHFIDRWKKRLNKDDESLIDDPELETMFIDDEENIGGNKKKSNEKQNKSEVDNRFHGFLIDNIKDESDEMKPTTTKSTKRTTSNSSTTTTLDSDCQDDDDIINLEKDSSSKTSHDDDDGIEIIKTYPTRSRTTITNDKHNDEDDQNPIEEASNETNSEKPWLDEMREQFWFPFLDMLPEESQFDIELSGKFLILKYILDKCGEIGDKILLFSRSLYTLNHIEKFLKHLQIQNEKEYQKQCDSRRELREFLSSNGDNDNIINTPIPEPVQWKRDLDYFRMDGQTEITTRKRYAKSFNDLSNLRARLFLISTLAGGIGINLVGSNRVIVFDASWNPSHDTQAIFRSYRFGQKKPVFIYRLLAQGTMEEKIYQRQVVKQSMSQRVVDDHQLDRHFTQNDIKELYKFQPEQLPEAQTESTVLNFKYTIPKDHLLLDLLYEHNRWIHSYHSHDSLLENKLDEGLTAEERRRALEEYENLKRLPDPRQIAIQRFQQQQRLNAYIAQQSAAAAHASRIQQLNPELYQAFQNINGEGFDYARMIQQLNAMRNENAITNNNKKTTAGPVPILPRPPSNVVIVVESDEEPNGDITNTSRKD